MASFRFEAADATGRIEKGLIESDSPRAARAVLRSRDLVPLMLEPVSTGGAKSRTEGRSRRFSESELALTTRQIASLLSARMPLSGALAAAIEQAEHQGVRETLSAVRSEVVAGHRLADALAQFPREFPEVFRATVSAGEDSGDLGKVMERLADYIEARQVLRGKVLAAFVYPTVVIAVAFAIVLFLMSYVVPQVVEVFRQTRQALPWITRLLIGVSDILRGYWFWMLLAAAVAGEGVRRALRQPQLRANWDAALLRVPVFGRLIRATNAARFAATLAILTGSGVPLLRALDAARATMANVVLARAVDEALSSVREGSPLARALGATQVFPPMLVHLVASGEATGELASMLDRAATSISREVERRTLLLTTLLEPLLILAMGGVVLGIVLAVLMPIIEINQLVR